MKLIIAGGRGYELKPYDYENLDALAVVQVVSGGCSGADKCGEDWAKRNQIPVIRFEANWKENGRAAGPIRNRKMAKYADAVALFPGGAGTESMFREAKREGITIYDFRGAPQ